MVKISKIGVNMSEKNRNISNSNSMVRLTDWRVTGSERTGATAYLSNHIIVLYDDEGSRIASEMVLRQSSEFRESGLLSPITWVPFGQLEEAKLAWKYFYEGKHAVDILVASNNRQLPPAIVRRWLGMLIGDRLAGGGRLIAVAGNLGISLYDQYPLYPYCERVAMALGMEFVPYMYHRCEKAYDNSRSALSERANKMSHVLATILEGPNRAKLTPGDHAEWVAPKSIGEL
jgi:hypothetical protein